MQQLRTEIEQGRTELHIEVRRVRVELLRWMLGFWVSTLIATAGLAISLR